LAKIYAVEDLSINGKNYKQQVNNNILDILQNEAVAQIFDDGIFKLLEYVLLTDIANQTKVLRILNSYLESGKKVPGSTIFAVENLTGTTLVANAAITVLKKAIKNKCQVGEKTLQIFADVLYLNENAADREEALNTLNLASDFQDLPDSIFDVLELEKAAKLIGDKSPSKTVAISFLRKEAYAGKRFTISVFQALAAELNKQEVQKIVLRAAENAQIIPHGLLEKLVARFDPMDTQNGLAAILLRIVRNNQLLPRSLIPKLVKALSNDCMAKTALLIFALQAQNGGRLPKVVQEKLLAEFLTTQNDEVKEECLHAVYAMIQRGCDLNAQLIMQTLIHGFDPANRRMAGEWLAAFILLTTQNPPIDEESKELLLKSIANPDCSEEIRNALLDIINMAGLTAKQQAQIELIAISRIAISNITADQQIDVLLIALARLSAQVELLPQNFEQLSIILDERSVFQARAINILFGCLNKGAMPLKLVNSILVLRDSTIADEIKSSCDELLKQIAQVGVFIPYRARLVAEPDPAIAAKRRRTGYQSHAKLSATFFGDAQVSPLKTLQAEIALLPPRINIATLQGYISNIKSLPTNEVIVMADQLSDLLLAETQTEEIDQAIFLCLVRSIEVSKLSAKAQTIIEEGLNSNDAFTRQQSFRALRAAKNNQQDSSAFDKWCNDAFRWLEIKANRKLVQDLNLLDIFISLKNGNVSAFEAQDQFTVVRNLLMLDFLEDLNTSEKYQFYNAWLVVEDSIKAVTGPGEESIKSSVAQFLRQLHDVQITKRYRASQLQEILLFLSVISYPQGCGILLNSNNVYEELKQAWLITLIQSRLVSRINEQFVKHLAELVGKLSVYAIEIIFKSLGSINNVREFELFIDFIEKHQAEIDLAEVKVTNLSAASLQVVMAVQYLSNKIQNTEERIRVSHALTNLLAKGWPFDQLELAFNRLSPTLTLSRISEESNLIQVLEILDHYHLAYQDHPQLLNTLDWGAHKSAAGYRNCVQVVNEVAIKETFQQLGKMKSTQEIVQELLTTNAENSLLLQGLNNGGALVLLIEKIKAGEFRPIINDLANAWMSDINDWDQKDIEQWSQLVRSHPDYVNSANFVVEAVAITKRANFLAAGYQLTDAQILSCLLLLDKPKEHGRLLQVATGEGKSTIISVCAVVNALKGKKVDIITSSPVLAERDAKEKASLYRMFGLTCAHNNDNAIYLKGEKDCYKKDIVYGEVAQFQFDTLRDQYSLLGTLAGRKTELAIVDEVDSMLIDDSSKIARLSSTVAGIDQLQPIYHFIWQRLITLTQENSEETLLGNLEEIKKQLINYIKSLLDSQLKVPANLKAFINIQIPKWIDSAILAKFFYRENEQYIVHDGIIKPVDNGTGVIQSSTQWGDGLHQFLQIKEGVKITSETFVTNFLSNMGYFQRYGNNLVGLTGTLGSAKAKEVLADVYKVDFIDIPRSRQKQHLQFSPIVANSEEQWLKEVCRSAKHETNKNRGVLIICETIEQAQIIAEKLKSDRCRVTLYTRNNEGQEHEVEKIAPREIIVATNLAGRGTDIQTTDVEQYGGMHVIVTFLPDNQRIEDQAFGRTSRQGKRGSGQMIVNYNLPQVPVSINMHELLQVRDSFEADKLESFRQHELKIIKTKDLLFSKFCNLLDNIRKEIRRKNNDSQTVYEQSVLASIEEEWAMFLRRVDSGEVNAKNADQAFEDFSTTIRHDYAANKIIKNPWYHTAIGYDLLLRSNSLESDQYRVAMQHFEQAIELDPEQVSAAYIGKGWLLLKGKIDSNGQDGSYKNLAVEVLNKGLKLLNDEIALLTAVQSSIQILGLEASTALSKQLIQKISILGSYLNSVQSVINGVQASRRLVDVKGTNGKKSSQKTVFIDSGIERDSNNKVNIDFDRYDSWDIAFNDLTVMSDVVEIDQAVETLDAVCGGIVPKTYRGINIKLKQFSFEHIKILLHPNINISELSKEDAIKQLTDKKAFFYANLLAKDGLSPDCRIDLEIVFDNKPKEVYKNLTQAKAKEIIEKQTDKECKINLAFLNANDLAKFYHGLVAN
jgi:superfamily II DNA or RNA helicase